MAGPVCTNPLPSIGSTTSISLYSTLPTCFTCAWTYPTPSPPTFSPYIYTYIGFYTSQPQLRPFITIFFLPFSYKHLLTKMTPISNTSSSWNKKLSKRDDHVSFDKIREYKLHQVVCAEVDGDDDDDDDGGSDFAPAA